MCEDSSFQVDSGGISEPRGLKGLTMNEEGIKNAGMTFAMQIGLVRESVTVVEGDITLATLKDIACGFVDKKVGEPFPLWQSVIFL